MTRKKSLTEWRLMFDECEGSEAMAVEDQKLMGDACKELREAHGLQRNAVALALRTDSLGVTDMERRCSTETAKKYRAAVLKLSR